MHALATPFPPADTGAPWRTGRAAGALLRFGRFATPPRMASLQQEHHPRAAGLARAAGDDGLASPEHAEHAERDQRDAHLATLLADAARGNGHAFEHFYDTTVAHARALARRMLRSAMGDAACDDLLADAFFEAWRNAPRFDAARGSAITWLLQIVRSRALDALRRHAAHPSVELGDDDEASVAAAHADDHDPAARLWRSQAGTRLHAALQRLTPPERWVLGLAYFRELSHAEIATATALPLGTVKSHIQRAQAKLRAALAELAPRITAS